MDESGISTVPNKTPTVISPVGKKNVCKCPVEKEAIPSVLFVVSVQRELTYHQR
jgi:hypothetical protein